MNFDGIFRGLSDILTVVAPAATALGVPHIGLVTGALEVAQNIKTRIDEGKVVMGDVDREKLDALIEKLQAENDKLAAIIAGEARNA